MTVAALTTTSRSWVKIMSAVADHTYAAIGENKGSPRIYIQGLTLPDKGFSKGATYLREDDLENGIMRLVLDENGDKVVSGKQNGRISVIDINNKTIPKVFGDAQYVRIDILDGFIEISVDHIEQKKRERELAWSDAVSQRKVTKGTLFAGIGMSTLALHDSFAGHGIDMTTSWVVDRENKFLQVAHDNNRAITDKTKFIQGSIERLESQLLSQVNICQFSASCRGHSRAGKSKNNHQHAEQHSDTVGVYGLLKSFEHINAAFYISENVIEAKTSTTYMIIRSVLELLGYSIYEMELDNQQSGSFENRKRYWFVAVSNGLKDLDLTKLPVYPKTYETLGDLMEPISDDDPMWSDNDYLKAKAITDAAAGKGFKRQLVDKTATKVGCINANYAKKQSSPPMVVRDQDDKERLLTVIEHARAKSCDESLVQDLSATLGHYGLGQGVDMNQARGIAALICDHYFV